LLQHALAAAQGACPGQVTLVVGHDADAIQTVAAGLFDSVVTNERYQDGIGSSIATGIRACRNGADAILVILGDQPLVTGEHLANIIAAWTGSESEIIATQFKDTSCPPILFPRGAYDALSALCGDLGAREVLMDERFDVRTVEFSPAQYDVDTPEDLQRIDRDS
jgi:molybdenum cofactor cytidylyltransferase